jgi:hypothetical protein
MRNILPTMIAVAVILFTGSIPLNHASAMTLTAPAAMQKAAAAVDLRDQVQYRRWGWRGRYGGWRGRYGGWRGRYGGWRGRYGGWRGRYWRRPYYRGYYRPYYWGYYRPYYWGYYRSGCCW